MPLTAEEIVSIHNEDLFIHVEGKLHVMALQLPKQKRPRKIKQEEPKIARQEQEKLKIAQYEQEKIQAGDREAAQVYLTLVNYADAGLSCAFSPIPSCKTYISRR